MNPRQRYPVRAIGRLVREGIDTNGGSTRKCAERTGLHHMRLQRLASGEQLPYPSELETLEIDPDKAKVAIMADLIAASMLDYEADLDVVRKATCLLKRLL